MVSLETSLSKAVFYGNGVTESFSFLFRVWDKSELLVLVSAGDGKLQDVTAQCSITLTSDGGTVTYTPNGKPIKKGLVLIVLRNMPFLQDVRLLSGTRFDPAVIEEALDRATAERQQLLEWLRRAVVVPADSQKTAEEFSNELFDAAARAEAAAGQAKLNKDESANQAGKAEAEADRAKAEADRAAQAVVMGVRAENGEAVWVLESDVQAEAMLELPVYYFAGRNMLHLSYNGVELYPGPQYEEVGEKDTLVSSVKIRIPLTRGDVMHAWSVASNVARYIEEAEARAKADADRAKTEADRAAKAVENAVEQAVTQATEQANRAEGEANRAAQAVTDATKQAISKAGAEADRAKGEADKAETAKTVAQNAAQEATEQAERADEAAVDAAKYRQDTYKAARCVALNLRSRALASVREYDFLQKVPSGFFVINEEIIVPGTIQKPLTPVDSVAAIPNCDGFYLLVPPFEEDDCPPQEQVKPQKPVLPNWVLPCGKRARV